MFKLTHQEFSGNSQNMMIQIIFVKFSMVYSTLGSLSEFEEILDLKGGQFIGMKLLGSTITSLNASDYL